MKTKFNQVVTIFGVFVFSIAGVLLTSWSLNATVFQNEEETKVFLEKNSNKLIKGKTKNSIIPNQDE